MNLAIYLLINRAPNARRLSKSAVRWAIGLLTFTAVVFRSEVVLLLGPIVLFLLLNDPSSLFDILRVGIFSGITSMSVFLLPTMLLAYTIGLMRMAAIALTVAVDSYFWGQWPLWPEFYGLYFNVVQGKSSEWGVRSHIRTHTHPPPLPSGTKVLSSNPKFCFPPSLSLSRSHNSSRSPPSTPTSHRTSPNSYYRPYLSASWVH